MKGCSAAPSRKLETQANPVSLAWDGRPPLLGKQLECGSAVHVVWGILTFRLAGFTLNISNTTYDSRVGVVALYKRLQLRRRTTALTLNGVYGSRYQ